MLNNTKPTAEEDDELLNQQDELNKQSATAGSKKTKVIIISLVVLVVLVGIILMWVFLIGGSGSSDDNKPDLPTVNAYMLSGGQSTEFGKNTWTLAQNPKSNFALNSLTTSNNVFAETVTFTATLLGYQALRFQVDEPGAGHFKLPDEYLNPDFDAQFQTGLKFSEFHLKAETDKSKPFTVAINDADGHPQIQTTDLLFMSHYKQMGFLLDCNKLYGLGERTRQFELTPGTYNIYSQENDFTVDTGNPSKNTQQMGSHPFLIGNKKGKFFGIFILNTNPQTFQIKKEGDKFSVKYMTIGGVLDVFFFMGPSYQDVVRQYHKVIGKAILPPLWANGFQTKSPAYTTDALVAEAVKAYQDAGYPLETVVLPLETIKDQYALAYSVAVPATVKQVRPWTSLIPTDNALNADLKTKGLLLTYDDHTTAVQVKDHAGKVSNVVDWANPAVTAYFQAKFKDIDVTKIGLWLAHNTPLTTGTVAPTTADIFMGYGAIGNPFTNIPKWPANANQDTATAPLQAQHQTTQQGKTKAYQYHFDVHAFFGTKQTLLVHEALPTTASTKSLIISDSTFAGAGARGAAHLLARNTLSYDGVQQQLAGILNFNMFGIPTVGSNLCGSNFAKGENTDDLCLRSFQLSIISPLAVYSNDAKDLSAHPYKMKTQANIASVLKQRMQYMVYMRTQLYRVQQFGGALVQPLLADKHLTGQDIANTEDSVLYGEAMRVDFVTKPATDKLRNILFFDNWLDVNTFQQYNIAVYKTPTLVKVPVDDNKVFMFQRGATIIPMQDPTKLKTTDDIKNTPIQLSIYLNPTSAIGHLLVENGDAQEYYEIRANANLITMKQQNEGAIDYSAQQGGNNKQIEKFMISPVDKDAKYFACALHNDMLTTQTFKTAVVASTDKDHPYYRVELTPTDQKAAASTISVDDVAFIIYGADDGKVQCNLALFGGVAGDPILNTATHKQYKITQNSAPLHTVNTPVAVKIDFEIEQGQDYLHVTMQPFDDKLEQQEEPKVFSQRILDSDQVSDEPINLDDFLEVSVGTDILHPFYYAIFKWEGVGEQREKKYLFTTQNQPFFFNKEFSFHNFIEPQQDPARFFGIGERAGEFFLQEDHIYSLFTNDNNLPSIKQAKGRTLEFCKNGFFPIIFSQSKTTRYIVTTHLGEGSKDIYFRGPKNPVGAQITVVESLSKVNMRIVFGHGPIDTMKKLYKNPTPAQVQIPPTWAYGNYQLMNSVTTRDELDKLVNFFYTNGWGIEGLMMTPRWLNGYESLSYDKELLGEDPKDTIGTFNNAGMTIIQISKTGLARDSKAGQHVTGQHLELQYHGNSVVGHDQQGQVVYPDYFNAKVSTATFINNQVQKLQDEYGQNRLGVQLIENELTNFYCGTEGEADNYNVNEPHQLFQAGTHDQIRRSFRREEATTKDTHNGYGYQQTKLITQHNDFDHRKFWISSSTTYKSGQIGNVGHMFDYIPQDQASLGKAIRQVQQLSILGISNIGEKTSTARGNFKTTADKINRLTLGFFTPLSAQEGWEAKTLPDPKEWADYGASIKFKYMVLKYSITQSFLSAIDGVPVINPAFFYFPQDELAYSVIDNQYMYGPSLMTYLEDSNIYIPTGTWCTTLYQDLAPTCIDGDSTKPYTQALPHHSFLREGTITPLQDTYAAFPESPKVVMNTFDLTEVPIDFHINSHAATHDIGFHGADGQLIMFEEAGSIKSQFCTLTLSLVEEDALTAIKATLTYAFTPFPTGAVGTCTHKKGYNHGKIFILNAEFWTMNEATVTLQDDKAEPLTFDIIAGKTKTYAYYDIKDAKGNVIPITDIKSILFS